MKNLTIITLLLAFVFFYGQPAHADITKGIFPVIEGWELISGEKIYTPDNLWDLIDGAADAYLSYDFQDLHLADYENDKGITIRVELYRHSTLDNAFGIYTNEYSPDYHFINIGSQGYLEEGALNFLCGSFYVKISTHSSGKEAQEAMVYIGNKLQEHLKQELYWPEVFRYLPEGEPYGEHYIAENFLGFEFLHSAFTVNYRKDDANYQAFIIQDDDPVVVQEMLRKYFTFTKQDVAITDGIHIVKDPYNGDVWVLLKNNILAGVVNSPDEKTAQSILGKIEEKL